MELNFKHILTASMVLFAVIDIIGNIPIIIDLRRKTGHIQSGKATIIAGIILTVFLFVGESLLSLIDISASQFAIAGSFVLFFLALEMILGITIFKEDGEGSMSDASVFPIAFPLVAGPGSLTSILSLRAEFSAANIVIAILINMIIMYAVLKASAKIERMLGQNGIRILRKVFGVILLAIAVKIFTTGMKQIFL
ncbi:MarC family protein [Kordia sp.]|uniref:MarC family protein n=1 Tax=Kordia sp. TaxID=1965332 RepID=UPI0025C45D37|nr:MarC family protein [Kordia sp.]MCH2195721.1 MarC family protein [Kordia sp.]